MNTLDPIQRDCARLAALTGLGAGSLRRYQRKADKRDIFTREEESLVNHNAKPSAVRSINSLRLGGKSDPNPSFVPFAEDYNIFDRIELRPDAAPILPEFTYELYKSQFDRSMARSK